MNIDNNHKIYVFIGSSRPLDFDSSYTIHIDENVFQNIYGNNFQGISNDDVIYFSTEASHPPIVQEIIPESKSINNINFSIDISFNETVFIGDGNFICQK